MVLAKCTKCGGEHELVYYKISTKDKGQGCNDCPRKHKEVSLEEKRLRGKHANIKVRCFNKTSKDYINYGGRGITVCQEWCNNRDTFVKWALENGYELGLEIDRIDNNGNYSPENCRWVTKRENSRKTRQVKLTEQDAWDIRYGKYKDKTINEIYPVYKCSWSTIHAVRIFKSWEDINEDYFKKNK